MKGLATTDQLFQAPIFWAVALGIAFSLNLSAATFTDANWISMGSIRGTDGAVLPDVVDGVSNLYIGGEFTLVEDVLATRVAKWNGSGWSALGSGISGSPDYP